MSNINIDNKILKKKLVSIKKKLDENSLKLDDVLIYNSNINNSNINNYTNSQDEWLGTLLFKKLSLLNKVNKCDYFSNNKWNIDKLIYNLNNILNNNTPDFTTTKDKNTYYGWFYDSINNSYYWSKIKILQTYS